MAGERKGNGLVFASLAVTVVAVATVIIAPLAVVTVEFESVTLSDGTTEHTARNETQRITEARRIPLHEKVGWAPVAVTGVAALVAAGLPALLRRRFALAARLSGSLILWCLSAGAVASVGFFFVPSAILMSLAGIVSLNRHSRQTS
ncbi:MAG: hypothetical protein WD378_06130 [Egicoccus sp.]